MISSLVSIFATPFILGLLTPLTAVCVLPLYPGFLVYLSRKVSKEPPEKQKKMLILFGLLITAGVVLFMGLLGLLFTTILKVSLTDVIGIVSPIAFLFLLLISVFLIFDFDLGRFIPRAKTPRFKNPFVGALSFGFFFGAIVVPCSPLFIAALFATTTATTDFLVNMLRFAFFGVGIGAPLLAFSALSIVSSDRIIKTLVTYQSAINRTAGISMFVISLYYLLFVFKIFG